MAPKLVEHFMILLRTRLSVSSLFLYKTETSASTTIFHVSTIFKYNIKTNLKKKKKKKKT